MSPVVEEAATVRASDSFIVNISRSGGTRDKCRSLWRAGTPRVLVGITGEGELEHAGTDYPVGRGDIVLLAAAVGACSYRPRGAVSLLEVALPE